MQKPHVNYILLHIFHPSLYHFLPVVLHTFHPSLFRFVLVPKAPTLLLLLATSSKPQQKKTHMRIPLAPSLIFLISRSHSICKVLFFAHPPPPPLLPPEAAQNARTCSNVTCGVGMENTASCIRLSTPGLTCDFCRHICTLSCQEAGRLHPVPTCHSHTERACAKAVKFDVPNL
jgi:hypothetical protein